ncbi:sulfite exporter TauE/SafE family protein [Nocardioides panzhihuensis]|uniref:Probable membrane transporter protein n=1 Tax=Nocardioides panzhihuensis TaxID=860243 RepID=A0A7Z0IVQ6_9ACTN|nr:sulfite exporter TauE/SafE family protein [Nocardioides panzhihuensis]NYI81262.1 putative membrane protein YfcA [Nocardioides panzhihuensis]
MTAATTSAVRVTARRQSVTWPFAAGALIGILGGLIGLGGAEFRLPLLMALFGFAALQAVILNKAMSLVVVIAALPARAFAVPWDDVAGHWWIVVNLLAGSLVGAWAAAGWATRMHSRTLHRVLALLLVAIALVLAGTHYAQLGSLDLPPAARVIAGVIAGVLIGMVAAFMGVAGGELLIPTIVLLFGADIRLAGSLSLLVSLPTMLVAFTRYSRDGGFTVLRPNLRFVALMGAGSVAGAVAGGVLLQYVAGPALIGALALILLVSATKVWRHSDDT